MNRINTRKYDTISTDGIVAKMLMQHRGSFPSRYSDILAFD